ncbi:hypothetical protein RintRC_1305 [Richelia intracellularis]|nr:hypothetical protein RintRC_1305 [Richelia intracellularis]
MPDMSRYALEEELHQKCMNKNHENSIKVDTIVIALEYMQM